jgi:hypothetical protein
MASPFLGVFTVGQTIDRGIKLYKMVFGRMFILLVIPMLFMMSPMYTGMGVSVSSPLAGSLGVFYLVGAVMSVWVTVIIVRGCYNASISGKADSFGTILGLATAKDFLLIVTGVIWFLALAAGFVLLIVPGIYLMNLLMLLGYPVAIVERKYFFNGVGRVMALGRKRWWKTVGVGCITMLIFMVPLGIAYSIFIAAVVNSVAGGAMMADPSVVTKTGVSIGAMVGMLLYSVVVAALWPFWAAVSVVHYNSLRSEKESTDIAAQLDALSAPKA